MILVTSDLSRGNRRVVYAPREERGMVHQSHLSPDGKSILIVTMDGAGQIVPARSFLSKAQPSSANSPRQAAAAPAPRGPWMASGRTSIFLWARARTSGACAIPTASSSKSRKAPPRRKICSWRLTENLWSPPSAPRSTPRIFTIRTATRRSATAARFTRSFPTTEENLLPETNGQTNQDELWVKEIGADHADPVLPGYPMSDYSVSNDGKFVAFVQRDKHLASVWLRHRPPQVARENFSRSRGRLPAIFAQQRSRGSL